MIIIIVVVIVLFSFLHGPEALTVLSYWLVKTSNKYFSFPCTFLFLAPASKKHSSGTNQPKQSLYVEQLSLTGMHVSVYVRVRLCVFVYSVWVTA